MQVEAIYNQGRLEFVQPLRLKHERFRLLVNVPDDEVAPESATARTFPSHCPRARRVGTQSTHTGTTLCAVNPMA